MKTFKRTATLFVALMLLAGSLFCLPVSAASASIGGAATVTRGNSFTVTVSFNSDSPVYTAQVNVTYDSSKLTLNSTSGADCAKGNGTANFTDDKLSTSDNKVKSGSYSLNFIATASGSAVISVSGYGVNEALQKENFSQSKTITINEPVTPQPPTPTASSDANLTSLKVSGGTLSPAFSRNTTKYTVSVPYTTDKVTITAGAVSGATFVGAGTFNLKVGDNSKTITVTAENGKTKKSYTVNIRRLTEAETTAQQTETPEKADPLAVKVNGDDYKIVTDIASLGVFDGYEPATEKVNDIDVGVLKDNAGKYKLFYLTDSNGKGAYYNLNGDKYERIDYIIANGKMYIILKTEDKFKVPNGYREDKLTLDCGDVYAIKSTNKELSDFNLLYCYYDGKSSFYRYDAKEKTFQRATDFEISLDKSTTASAKPSKISFSWFTEASTLGKVLIGLIAAAGLIFIALIVLIIVRVAKGSNEEEMPVVSLGEEIVEEEQEEEEDQEEQEQPEDKEDDNF